MEKNPARKYNLGENETEDAERSSGPTQEDEAIDSQSEEPKKPIGNGRKPGRSGSIQASTVGGTPRRQKGGLHSVGGGYVDYERGPDHRALSDRYGLAVRMDEAGKLQRLETEFGRERVSRWVDEGMTVEIMGKPRDMRAFRERQESRPDQVPTDVERRNDASVRRNATRNRDDDPAGETGTPDAIRSVVSSIGRSMDETVQREMEAKIGGSFSDVRIHAGPEAAAAADAINARAFTVGNHVAFNEGEYKPATDDGKKLIAHELTHVRQQTEGVVSLLPKADADHPAAGVTVGASVYVQPKLEVSSPDDPAEKEAEEVAENVLKMDDEETMTETDADASDTGVDRTETETAAEGAETETPTAATEMSDPQTDGVDQDQAGAETATDSADSVQRTPDAGSTGEHVDSAADGSSATATAETSRGTASTADGTAADTVNPDEATASDAAPAVGGPGDSPNEDGDGTISVGRRMFRAADTGVEQRVSDIEAMYDNGPLQPKLEMSSPDSPAEKEAERIASAVTRMDDPVEETANVPSGQGPPDVGQSNTASPDEESVDPMADICPRCARRYRAGKPLNCSTCEEIVQAKCDECEWTDESVFRTATIPESGQIDRAAEETIDAVRRRSGESLPDETQTTFERRFGADFSSVEVHTGSNADEAARSINAEAFTVGTDIVFRSGAFRPRTEGGMHLLAHELTHVVQQRGQSIIQRWGARGMSSDGESASSQSGQASGVGGTYGEIGTGGTPRESDTFPSDSETILQELVEAARYRINDAYKDRFTGEPGGAFLPLHFATLRMPEQALDLSGAITAFVSGMINDTVPDNPGGLINWLEEIPEVISGRDVTFDYSIIEPLMNEDVVEAAVEIIVRSTLNEVNEMPEICDIDDGSSINWVILSALNTAVKIRVSDYEGPPVQKSDVCGEPTHKLVSDTIEETYGGWKNNLPDCPETVPGNKEPGNGEPTDEGFTDETKPHTPSVHEGAVYDYRKGGVTSIDSDTYHGQQCCYGVPNCLNDEYYLITPENKREFPGADMTTPGTPDVWSPVDPFYLLNHQLVDVAPAGRAPKWAMTAAWEPHPGVSPDPCDFGEEGAESDESDGESAGTSESGEVSGTGVGDRNEDTAGDGPGGGELEPEEEERIVREGDTLWEIAREVYGDPYQWRAIARKNGIHDQRNLQIGTVLEIPPLPE